MATQLVEPNLSFSGIAGYCLLLQYEVWSTPRPYDYAEQAWNNAAFKHPGEEPPSDVCVPLYWTYYDSTDKKEYGHIAAWIPGRGIFSSPFDYAKGTQWFANIQAVTDRINKIPNANSHYLGWTEDLAGIKLIEGDEPMFNEGDRKNQNDAFFGEDKGYFKEFVDKMTYKEATEKILGSAQYLGETRLNDGDLTNIFNKTGWPAEPAIKGWLWKRFWEDYASNKVGSGVDYEPVNETLYKKKA